MGHINSLDGDSNLKTSRAWAMRQQAMKLWDYSYRGAAEVYQADCTSSAGLYQVAA